MQRSWMLIVVAAVVATMAAGSSALAAQEPPEPPTPPTPPRASRAPRARDMVLFHGRHGRIGVVVRTDADPETDKLGAKLEAVTPGGPADKAGLKVGDIITKFRGTALGALPASDEEESGPGTKLVELARHLEPGDTARVEYRRGSDTKTATLIAEDLGPGSMFVMPAMPAMPAMPNVHIMRGFDGERFCFGDTWCDLDLVTLNPDLGEYFGTKEGVLVVKAPGDSSLPLRSGDVILAIGGRKPTSPSHAMRILRSYEGGEAVTIELMRKQKRMTIAWKVPSREEPSVRRRRGGGEEDDEQSEFQSFKPRARLELQRV
jgi:PDZ domain-containing protein